MAESLQHGIRGSAQFVRDVPGNLYYASSIRVQNVLQHGGNICAAHPVHGDFAAFERVFENILALFELTILRLVNFER